MTAQRRTKETWELCETISQKLFTVLNIHVTKRNVHEFLYQDIKAAGLLEACRDGDEEALKKVPDMPGYQRLENKKTVRAYQPKQEDPNLGPGDHLRLALWLIGKIGDPDQAVRAVQLAAKSVKELGK